MNKEKKICLWICILLAWAIGYAIYMALNGVIEVLRYSFVYGYTVISIFVISAQFLGSESKEE